MLLTDNISSQLGGVSTVAFGKAAMPDGVGRVIS